MFGRWNWKYVEVEAMFEVLGCKLQRLSAEKQLENFFLFFLNWLGNTRKHE